MPAGTSNSEQVKVVGDIAKYIDSCVMLEEQVHLYTDPANVLEHIGELHVLWVRAKAIETEKSKYA
jgi:hypothetical protein